MTAVKSMVPYPGGKAWLAPRLLPLPPHRCYVELFGGAAALLFAKPRSPIEVYNDIDGDLVALFRIVKYHPDELVRELGQIAFGREEFEARSAQPGLTDIQRAASFYWRHCMGFGGKAGRGNFGVTVVAGGSAQRSKAAMLARIASLSDRLDRVIIEHRDWARCLQQYDRAETCFFADPPYEAGRTNYVAGFDAEAVTSLAAAMRNCRGSWIVTLGDTPHVRRAFAWADITSVSRISRRNNRNGGEGKRITELVIRRPGQSADGESA